nr:DnaD domain protein [uncultured Mediterranean phage uvMED]
MSRKSGYFLVYRDIWRSPVFKNLLQCSCWIYMISSASHQDKELKFLDNKIFVRRGELILPLRVTAKRFKMSYSEMRTFILRLVRRKMVTTRLHHLQPTNNHPSRKVTLISLVNYDKYQYVDKLQPPTDHLSQQVLIHNNTNTHTNIGSSKDKVVNSGYKTVGDWGQHTILEKDGKRYLKHKWKDEPLKEYK